MLNMYVKDNPLHVEPQTMFDQNVNMVANVRQLLADQQVHGFVKTAHYIAAFDEEVGAPYATTIALMVKFGAGDAQIMEAIDQIDEEFSERLDEYTEAVKG